ncbi:MAG: MBL fold metallo-hydrolase [Steroidobacteraceae bacterium]|nr:MBL fold metallo-hydrolase [Nevskiaceae bacterium]MCP5338963.1 MBL fold metallo-hydrolase [Nevskiaceae bacterium]MCP5472582.1 MBL fold metallo-hydrolase [Nevskiaceae bacterium]
MKLSFLGAAREVTGSCVLVETSQCRFLIDCGMFQGGREANTRNRRRFEFEPAGIDFVLLTHAHIDHSGLLPRLAREGFVGPIYSTAATIELAGVMLPDSGYIQEMDAKRALRARRRSLDPRRAPAPLYTVQEARDCLKLLHPIDYQRHFQPHPSISCTYHDAGHILGSAIIEIVVRDQGKETRLVASGDLGQPGRPIVRDPTPLQRADVVLIESTYGDRPHRDLPATLIELEQVMTDTLRRGGNVIVPAFAVGRTQEVLYHLHQLARLGRLPPMRIFLDSPMAIAATEITLRHHTLFDKDARELDSWRQQGNGLPQLRFIASADESKALNEIRSGAVIIAASGMCEAGRIKHHLRHNLGRAECSVLITGFQAQGTLGRRLVDGAKRVRIFGEEVTVRASLHTLGGLSAHADQPALLAWARHFDPPPVRAFTLHGEMSAAQALADKLERELGWRAAVPEPGTTVTI